VFAQVHNITLGNLAGFRDFHEKNNRISCA